MFSFRFRTQTAVFIHFLERTWLDINGNVFFQILHTNCCFYSLFRKDMVRHISFT